VRSARQHIRCTNAPCYDYTDIPRARTLPRLYKEQEGILPFRLSSPRQQPLAADDGKAGHHPLALIGRTDTAEIQQSPVAHVSTY